MMQNKVLSISIASYNTEHCIEETVSSLIVEKEYLDKLDIIIVNDGSKDNTSEIAHKLENEFPDTIRVIDKDNGGYGSTINASLSIAKGKYYKLLDGDDWYKTENLIAFIDFLDRSDADLIVTPYYEVKKDDLLIDNHAGISCQKESIEKIEWNNQPILMHEIAVKTEVLKSSGKTIAEKCFYTDSEYAFYCLFYSKSISRANIPIYRYRLGAEGQSVSIEGIRKHYSDLPVVAERLFKCFEDNNTAAKTGTKREILEICIRNITHHTYRAYMLLKNPKLKKQELKNLDQKIRTEYPYSYLIGNKSKLVSTVRHFRFIGYQLLCYAVYRQFVKENA